MLKTILIAISFFFFSNLFAQINGFVKDKSTEKLIPYINIWVENEEIGTTSNEYGEYKLPVTEKNKILVFSAIGYETKKVEVSKLKGIIYLNPIDYQLSEVVILPKKRPKTLKIGSFKKSGINFYFAAKTPRIVARYFEYMPEYEKTPFLKTIRILITSRSANSTFNIRLYSVGKNGEPKDYICKENIIGTAEKGKKVTEIDISKLNLQFPKIGFFVAIEWLIIEENKYEFEYHNNGSKELVKEFHYNPSIGALPMGTNENGWLYEKGKWVNVFKNNEEFNSEKYGGKYSVIAVELTLTD